jgi:hypothetical protein
MSVLSMCNKTATISRFTSAASSMGTPVKTYAAVYTDIPFALQFKSGTISEPKSQREIGYSAIGYTPTSVSLQVEDRVSVDGEYWFVVGWGDMAGRGRAWKILLSK